MHSHRVLSATAVFLLVACSDRDTLAPPQLASPQWTVTAGAGDTWTPTGSMGVARRDHTATLLNDGTVLIVGWFGPGELGGGAVGPAELYDPEAGTFTSLGSTAFGHGQHSTATRLTDGTVLIVLCSPIRVDT